MPTEPPPPTERYGPLALVRLVKDDGRVADPLQPRHVSELRFNELRGEQVVYAVHRQDRTFLPDAEHCPLCPTRPGGPASEIPFASFEIAVFENLFPTFEAPAGAAEVVVYTDRPRRLLRKPRAAARARSDVGVAPALRGARQRARTSPTC